MKEIALTSRQESLLRKIARNDDTMLGGFGEASIARGLINRGLVYRRCRTRNGCVYYTVSSAGRRWIESDNAKPAMEECTECGGTGESQLACSSCGDPMTKKDVATRDETDICLACTKLELERR